MSTTNTPVNAAATTLSPDLLKAFAEQEQLSKDLLKLETGSVYIFKVLGVIHEMESEKGKRKNPDGSAQKAMEVANIFNFADKKQYQLIINHVLGNTLRESYPAHKYIGLTFRVAPTEVKTGRGGNKYQRYEIARGELKGVASPDAVPFVAPVEIKTDAPAETKTDAPAQTANGAEKTAPAQTQKPAPAAAQKPAQPIRK